MPDLNPIVILEDDIDDHEIFSEVFSALGVKNELIIFTDAAKALDFLLVTQKQPFLILSDINLPRMNGFELRNKVFTNKQLQLKCIPYLFFTSGANRASVIDAYAMSVQGFFLKPSSMTGLENSIKKIIEYWKECIAPSQYE